MILHELFRNPQADPVAKISFRAEKWLEDLVQMLRVNARPMISDHDLRSPGLPTKYLRGSDLQPSTPWHGVDGISNNV